MRLFASRVLLLISAILLLHASRSVVEFKAFIKASGAFSEARSIPMPLDIVIELMVAMVVGFIGAVWNSGKLSPIRAASEFSKRSYADSLEQRKSFRVYGAGRITIEDLAAVIRTDKKLK